MIVTENEKAFYTNEELREVRNKIKEIKIPNNYRHMKVNNLIEKYGEERTKKLIEEEVFALKNSMIMFGYGDGYKSVNGNESKIIDFAFKNKGEVMMTSIHDYIGLRSTVS